MVGFVTAAIEVELVNYGRRNTLMLLTKVEQESVWAGCENMDDPIGVLSSRSNNTSDLICEIGSVATARNGTLTRLSSGTKAEYLPNLWQFGADIVKRLGANIVRNAEQERDVSPCANRLSCFGKGRPFFALV